ncbi:MAG: ATP-dependent DNA helicase RecG [Flavobacteriales bacterium]
MMLEKEISFLKGVGPQRAESLRNELRIATWGDLLEHFPFRYIDRSQIIKIRDIQSDTTAIQLMGTFISMREMGEARAKRLVAVFRDESGDIDLVWFKGIKWAKAAIQLNVPYIIYGKPTAFKGRYNIPHPELELWDQARLTQGSELKPVYSTTEKLSAKGLNSNGFAKLTKLLIEEVKGQIPENLPEIVLERFKLMPRAEAFAQVHMPTNAKLLEAARRRLKFEELFFIQMQLVKQKLMNTREQRGVVFQKVGDIFNTFYENHLPFELTGAQKRVIKEIRADVARGYHMNRLIQGDVGSGKTIVALLSALLAIDNGYQVCLMAPTEILAQQHYHGISELLAPMGLNVVLLTGSTPKSQRKKIHEQLIEGQIPLIIGTHALIEPVVQFKNLGLVIIDEQHRFGVAQRASLWKKAALPPHVLVMTATPIPRTLAMTLYGDLDISVIDELPPGRKPIQTLHHHDGKRLVVFQFMEDEIKKGRQIYVVYPLIEESEAMDYKDLEDGYESLTRRFPLPEYKISVVHGRMKSEDRDYEMAQFLQKKTQIMVATTVIEVGVNVPNASVMVIESAERFGLSQLHQLRGRVGRGADQSYCILMTGHKLSSDARTRLETMVRTTDGFEIAEVDLQLRGPGDITGTQQSGLVNLRIADLARDQQMLSFAREIALEIIDDDPHLLSPKTNASTNTLNASKRSALIGVGSVSLLV